MRDNGKMIKSTEKGLTNGKMDKLTKETLKMERKMEMGSAILPLELIMKASGEAINQMASVSSLNLTEEIKSFIKDNLKMVNEKEKGFTSSIMEIFMMEIGNKAK